MNLFKTFSLKWWQAGVFKLSLLSLGLMIGSAWPGLFVAWRVALALLFVASTAYITRLWWKQ
jgi:hypothetical protein